MSDNLHSIPGPLLFLAILPSVSITCGSVPLISSALPAPLPPAKEVINGNIKTVTEYKVDEDGKKFKVRPGEETGAVGPGGGGMCWVGW